MSNKVGKVEIEASEVLYKIGEQVVHIPEGVCIIDEIVKMDTFNEEKEYYKLVPIMDKNSVLYVAINGPKKNIRKLRTKKEVLQILEEQKISQMHWEKNEERRISRVKEAIYKDDGTAIAKWIKVYYRRKKKERLTISDSTLLKKAEQLLYSEMSVVLKKEYNKLRAYFLDEINV